MRILIAEDDQTSRKLLETTLTKWGYEVTTACDGLEAWQILQHPPAPQLIILDWMMPRMDGLDLCRKIRATESLEPRYLILLTARDDIQDVVAGLTDAADDYITKPFHREELRCRVQVGARTLALQRSLAKRLRELEAAMGQLKLLRELLPMCCYCKRVRDDKHYWQQMETYLANYAELRFTHGICPECYQSAAIPTLHKFLEETQSSPTNSPAL
jgi:sigma-B regulation protein RsbU (phosphoserine phosphatase)